MLVKPHGSRQVELVRKRVSSSVTDDAIHHFFMCLDTPRSLAAWLLYKNQEHEQLVDLEVNPNHYNDGEAFRDDYVATNFLAKADFLNLEVSKKDRAMAKFRQFEDQCKDTNRRFKSLESDPVYNRTNVWLLNAVKRKISMILGDYNPEELVDGANWGPGNTTLLKGEHVSAYNKFSCETGITRDLYYFVKPWFSAAYPSCAAFLKSRATSDTTDDGFTMERGNVIITVPKNSKTDRVIAVEPGWNLWFQKGLGTMIRRRLSRVGVNLQRQEINQQFAKAGSSNGRLATVDFSSASDSIAYELVRHLLPHHWFTLLNSTRCNVGMDGDKIVKWEKFSSMGNGYTFELESLIFYAAALAVCEYTGDSTCEVSVFGDDVILPSTSFSLYSEFCAFIGFKVNPLKSYSTGYFRESCGAHYFGSIDCKPLYLKGKIRNVQAIYKLANGIRLLAHRYNNLSGCSRRFRYCWRYLFQRVDRTIRFGIPAGLGDGGFIVNFDEATPAIMKKDWLTWEGFAVMMVLDTGVSQECDGYGLVLDRVRGSQELARGNKYVLRGRVKTRISKVFTHTWYNLGSWS